MMRVRLHSKLIAALLAPALLASGATQGMQFMRCGSTVRMSSSCCCPKEAPPPASSVLTNGARQSCDAIAVPSAAAQNVERLVPIESAPVLVAVLGPLTSFEQVVERLLHLSRLDPRPGPSPVLANCALLI